MLRSTILIGCMVVYLFGVCTILSGTTINQERYVKLAERSFDRQDFDSCLYYNYMLAHAYTESKDSESLVNTWYTIAILNHLQKKYKHADAARRIANSELRIKTNDFSNLKGIYQDITNITNPKCCLSIILNESTRKVGFNQHICYIPLLLKAQNEYDNYQFDQVDLMLRLLLSDLKSRGDTNWFGYAKANMLMGAVFHLIDDYKNSITYFETAINIYNYSQTCNEDFITAYRLYLFDLNAMGQSEKVDSCFQRIERSDLINKNRAGFYYIKGDFIHFNSEKESIESYLQAYYSHPIDTASKNKLAVLITFYYVQAGQYNLAQMWMRKLEMNQIDIQDKIMIAYSYIKLGYHAKGNALINAIENSKLRYNEKTLYWLAKYYFELKNYEKAKTYYYKYLNYLTSLFNDNHNQLMLCYSEIAYLYWYGEGDYKKSLEYYHKAVFELVREHAPLNIYLMPDINQSINDNFLAIDLNNKGEALLAVSKLQKTKAGKIKDLKASLANFELSFTVAHRFKMSLSSDEQRHEFTNSIQHRYTYIIEACLELYKTTRQKIYADKAFEYAEKSRASLLLSTVRGVNALKMHMVPDNLKRAEEQIWTTTELISNYLSESYKAPVVNKSRIDHYNVKLGALKQQKDCLLRIFKTTYPGYYNIKYNAEVIKVDSLQKVLNPEEALLEYSVSDKNIVLYLITRNDFKIFTDSIDNEFYGDIDAYRNLISGFSYDDLRDSVIRLFAKQANRLYNILIKPAEPYIKNKKLIIVPDDVLTQIPFEALVTTPVLPADTATYSTMPYLTKEHSVTYSYSGTLYAMKSQAFNYINTKVLAVAPSYSKIKLSKFYTSDSTILGHDTAQLLPIPGIYEEARAIHHIFGGKILMKNGATEKQFKELAGKYEIVHLATHGIINNDYPLASKLVFTPYKDSINEGLLNTYEIYNLQIDAPLVVLSACNTGYGKLHKGEGIISLTRGFFTAGAKSILMTMWAVDDKTSSKLMQQFYSNLATKKNIGEALHIAKISYLKESDDLKAHPYFWAGYIILGNASATFEPYHDSTNFILWIAIGGLIMTGAVMFIKRKRRSLQLRR